MYASGIRLRRRTWSLLKFGPAQQYGNESALRLHPSLGCTHATSCDTLLKNDDPLSATTCVQSAAMARLCPSLTCECGKVGDEVGMQRAAELIHACLHLHHFPTERPPASDFHLLENTATIRIPQGMKISFDNQDLNADLHFDGMFDRWNFQRLAEGTVFCRRRPGSNARLSVIDAIGHDIAYDFFPSQKTISSCADRSFRRCSRPMSKSFTTTAWAISWKNGRWMTTVEKFAMRQRSAMLSMRDPIPTLRVQCDTNDTGYKIHRRHSRDGIGRSRTWSWA